jgi:hypothetical protein
MMAHHAVSEAPLAALVEVAALTVRRPAADTSVAGWTAVPGPALFSALDEAVADDADFVVSPVLGSGAPATLALDGSLSAGACTVRVRARRIDVSGQLRVQLLDAAGSVHGTSPWIALTPVFATHELAVTTSAATERVRIEVQP